MPAKRFTFRKFAAASFADLADAVNKQFGQVQLAMPNPIYFDLGTVVASTSLKPEDYSHARLTLGASVALTFPTTTVPDGERLLLEVTQDAAGSRLVSAWNGVTFPGGSAPTLTTGAGKTDLFEFVKVQLPNNNLVVSPDALATGWTKGGSGTVTNAVSTHAGRPFSRVVDGGSLQVARAVTLKTDGAKILSVWVRTNGATGVGQTFFNDQTASTTPGVLTWTVHVDGSVTAIASVGTLLGVQFLGDGVYKLSVLCPGCVALHTNVVYAFQVSTIASALISEVDLRDASPSYTWRCVNQQLNY